MAYHVSDHDVASRTNDALLRDRVAAPARLKPSRQYSPRNPRSCDGCRARKTACKINSRPPCMMCQTRHRECTFTQRTTKRQKIDDDGPSDTAPRGTCQLELIPPRQDSRHMERQSLSSVSSEEEDAAAMADRTTQRPAMTGGSGIPTSPQNHRIENHSIAPQPCSIDERPSQTAFLLGDTGESDPYLLQHSALLVDAGARDSDSKISYLKVRSRRPSDHDTLLVEDDVRPLVFMFIDHSLHARYEPRVDDD